MLALVVVVELFVGRADRSGWAVRLALWWLHFDVAGVASAAVGFDFVPAAIAAAVAAAAAAEKSTHSGTAATASATCERTTQEIVASGLAAVAHTESSELTALQLQAKRMGTDTHKAAAAVLVVEGTRYLAINTPRQYR